MPEKSYPDGDLLDIKQSAAFLDVSTKTIRRYIKAGKLSARKVRNVWFVPISEVETLKNSEAGIEPVQSPDDQTTEEQNYIVPDFIRRIDSNLVDIKQQISELDRRLYLFSQERESGRFANEDGISDLEARNEQLIQDNDRLDEQINELREELERARKNGPKDTQVLKQKSEENEALKATIASNQRGLSILRDEVRQYQNKMREKEKIIEKLRARIASLEKELADRKSARKPTLWGSRR